MKKTVVHILSLFIMMTSMLYGAAVIKDVSVSQRWPWNGSVDIQYFVECEDVTSDGSPVDVFVTFSGYDHDLNKVVSMTALTGDGVEAAVHAGGPYTAVWDATEAGEDFHSSAFSVTASPLTDNITYLIVDVTSGSTAKKYPYRYSLCGPNTSNDDYRTKQIWFRCIPPGKYTMGSPSSETGRDSQDMAQHEVTVSEAFYVGMYECTQKQWERVMGANPSTMTGNTRPVTNVSFDSIRGGNWPSEGHMTPAESFIGKLQAKTGLAFDLPTEAQWEYAGRLQKDGTCVGTALASGKDLEGATSCSNLAVVGRYAGNRNDGRGGSTQHTAAGSYDGTGVGLFDIHGNVQELCLDWLDGSTSSTAAVTDPEGPASGSQRVIRGGDWQSASGGCRLASRKGMSAGSQSDSVGFRLVQRHKHNITYGLTMTLTPATNTWTVDGETYASGETAYLDAGDHVVTFSPCARYQTPEPVTVHLDSTQSLEQSYVALYNLTCKLDIPSAKWTIDGKSYASGAKVELPTGSYEISFSDVTSYQAPPPQKFNLDKDMTITMYYMESMYLVVDISGGTSAKSFPYRYTMDAPDLTSDTCRTKELWLRVMRPGTFVMGSADDELGRKQGTDFPQHTVTLTEKFYIGIFEITQEQWRLVKGSTPSAAYAGTTRPMENVSYDDIRGVFDEDCGWPQDGHTVQSTSFMGVISKKTGLVFDLPTEAQWEYACRLRLDGTCYGTALNSGKNLSKTGKSPEMSEVGRYSYNTSDGHGGYTEHTTVGMYAPNEVGLYDMHGNVHEWCLDWHVFGDTEMEDATDPTGPSNSTYRVFRGGSHASLGGEYCRCAYRWRDFPEEKFDGLGFRIICLP